MINREEKTQLEPKPKRARTLDAKVGPDRLSAVAAGARLSKQTLRSCRAIGSVFFVKVFVALLFVNRLFFCLQPDRVRKALLLGDDWMKTRSPNINLQVSSKTGIRKTDVVSFC